MPEIKCPARTFLSSEGKKENYESVACIFPLLEKYYNPNCNIFNWNVTWARASQNNEQFIINPATTVGPGKRLLDNVELGVESEPK